MIHDVDESLRTVVRRDVLDGANGLLGAMTYDDARRELAAMPAINLQRAFEAAGRAGPVLLMGRGRRDCEVPAMEVVVREPNPADLPRLSDASVS